MNNGNLGRTPSAAVAESVASILAQASSSDEFGRVAAKLAVAQICESLGFDGAHSSVIDALIDIVMRCLRAIGKSSVFYANLSGRTQSNVFDVLRAFEDLGVSISNDPAMEFLDYAESCKEVPFISPIPQFPIVRDGRKLIIPSFSQMSEPPPGKHIPSWLPALPDPHTYKCTPIWKERKSDARNDKIEQARQRRKAERSLLSLQQRLAKHRASISGGASTCDHTRAQCGASTSGNKNEIPYLAVPLDSGELGVEAGDATGVWTNEMLKNKSFNIVEIFSPAIEAMKDRFCEEVDTDMKSMLPDKRPAVQFRFKTGKKVFGQSSDVDLWNKVQRRPNTSVFLEEERDDRKRRVEYILRQAAENPYELNQW
ncbi:hypothetical protein MLD38_016160 [Melastoma candidum]|uniref:Uncharacterized protein n=1 Tax=Melastoma candidum TaxID=119954 RepID=A0ACB9RIA1_9MYRT|nr:hypothetical protein MLD38_016160 [Melastoma candidum]